MVDQFKYTCSLRTKTGKYDLEVLSFNGVECIAQPYKFTIQALSPDDIELVNLSESRACLSIISGSETRYINGIVSSFSQVDVVKGKDASSGKQLNERYLYTLVIEPRFSLLKAPYSSDFRTQKNIIDIIKEVMEYAHIPATDYQIQVDEKKYIRYPLMAQYQESALEFLERVMFREGIYYYFIHLAEHVTKVVFCDDISQQTMLSSPLRFRKTQDVQHDIRVDQFVFTENAFVPEKIAVKGYDPLKPSAEIMARSTVSKTGYGEKYYYEESIESQEAAEGVMNIRTQQLLCEQKKYSGKSNAVQLYPGAQFILTDHFNSKRNMAYQLTKVVHSGNAIVAGLNDTDEAAKSNQGYHNDIECLDSTQQFRPVTKKDHLRLGDSIIRGVIISDRGDEYGDINEYGQYKVEIISDHPHPDQERERYWITMMQPYDGPSGTSEGTQSVLRASTEVLIGFIDGDLRRPVILGTISNAKNLTVATDPRKHKTSFPSGGGTTSDVTTGKSSMSTHQTNSAGNVSSFTVGAQLDEDLKV